VYQVHEAVAVINFRIIEFRTRRQPDLTPELFEEVKSLSCFYITSREICIGSETFLHTAGMIIGELFTCCGAGKRGGISIGCIRPRTGSPFAFLLSGKKDRRKK
jgi:hypothetical protein